MFKRVSLLFCACAFMFLAACAGSKSSGGSSYYDDSDDGGGYSSGGGKKGRGGGEDRPPRADELKDAKNEASALTEENHKLAKEIFDLKNKLGMPTDD
ncbi:MAG: hypothetical protein LBC75_06450 [Fibromonadaceae bacterium]|jgi:hypothetical protein|nr:hypothetical protein [Fibromonadaceae bacterium]